MLNLVHNAKRIKKFDTPRAPVEALIDVSQSDRDYKETKVLPSSNKVKKLATPRSASFGHRPHLEIIKQARDRDDTQIGVPPRPFVKWAGGKRQLLEILNAAAPKKFNRYYEPFIGGGAFLFSQLPEKATISDINAELVNCFEVIHDEVGALIRSLRTHKNDEGHFYAVRAKLPIDLSRVQRASRFIFLNKTCFNGLYRENQKGQFNAPFGRYEKPNIADAENLKNISNYLNRYDIKIKCSSYQYVLDEAQSGDFVYFDPPYAPMTKTANFAHYVKGGFGLEDQANLAKVFTALTKKGVLAMLSNSNTKIIHELYKGFNVKTIHATRAINCKGGKRGKEENEVLVTNY